MVLSMAILVAPGQYGISSELDLMDSQREESDGENTDRLFKISSKDNEEQFPMDEDWNLMDDDSTLLYDQHFQDQFFDDSEMVQDINDVKLAFEEGKKVSYSNVVLHHIWSSYAFGPSGLCAPPVVEFTSVARHCYHILRLLSLSLFISFH